MKKLLLCGLALATMMSAGASGVQAQTRADSAAVLLEAAEQLRQRGDPAAARAVLALISDRYAGTPAASAVAAMLDAMRSAPAAERSGRTELMVWGTTYGGWLGVTVPYLADSESPEAYGLGLLIGAPAGFLAARAYADGSGLTRGQARALTFGSVWGTFQGFGWAEHLELGRHRACTSPADPSDPCYTDGEDEGRARVGAAVAGGLAGIGVGALLARKPISEGTAAAVSLSGMWGTWFGFAGAYVADIGEDDMLVSALLGGNAALLGSALLAPGWNMTESRARLISVGGVIGGLGGAGLVLIAQPENERVAVAIPLLTSIAGLAVAARRTADDDGDDGAGRGALLNRDERGWGMGTPAVSLRMEQSAHGSESRLHVPLLNARFR